MAPFLLFTLTEPHDHGSRIGEEMEEKRNGS
jgi:hypothetical protein